MQGAQLEGYEGVKQLNLKFNKKRVKHGLQPIDLSEVCAEDLEKRKKDQEELFNYLIKVPIDETLQSIKTSLDVR